MKAVNLDTDNAGFYAFAAARDASMKAAVMWSHYTSTERTRAERMALGLELCYSASAIYIDPRQKFISVKVDKPVVRDRKNLALLEKDYEKLGDITKAKTKQGITYRIAKA